MGAIGYKDRTADVICQHRRDGSIIPLKIRFTDDDGEFQTYQIRAYKDLTHPGDIALPNGVRTLTKHWSFECKIVVFERERRMKLFYDSDSGIWQVGEGR